MRVKRNILTRGLLALALMALVVLPTSAYAGSPSSEKDIVFGVSTAITGPAPLEGERTKQAITMAVEEINQKGGVLGRPLKPLIEDDQNTANVAVNAVNKLISENVVTLLGPHRSGNASAVQHIVARNKIPFMTGGTSPKLVTFNNPYLFRIRASDQLVAKVAAKYAVEELKAKKVGVFYNNDEYGTGAKGVIEEYLKSIKIPVVSEGHNLGDKDMTGQIAKMKNEKIDCLISWSHVPETAVVVRQLKELNLNVPVIGGPTHTNQEFLGLVDAAAIEGHFSVTDFAADNPAPRVQDFTKRVKAKYNIVPEIYVASYYDATFALADAIKRANSAEREAIRKALSATTGLQGVMSTLSANDKNELVHEAVIVRIKNKVPQLVKTVRE
jgi:branched-chain amino acid transport system substrate-binding protein